MASPRRTLIAVVTLSLTLVGCFTGERPRFEDGPGQELTGRDEIDSVLRRLDATPGAQFTADYDILTRLYNRESTATVVQAEDGRRSITINSVRYLFDGATIATCDLDAGTCEAENRPQATYGELFVDQDFYAVAPATRLRNDARGRIGDPVNSDEVIGGEPALCVAIPITGGTVSYCALETGALARYEGNDLTIELTGYSPTPDESKFASS